MLKLLLIIDCDFCRQQFSQTKMASSDTIALKVHGENLRRSAEAEGWSTTECNSSHFCPECDEEILEMERLHYQQG